MLFSSIIFIFYFLPSVLTLYYLLSFSRKAQNILLLTVSLLFYAWGEGNHLLLLLASVAANWGFGLLAHRFRGRKTASVLTVSAMCVFNLGLLFIFKYLGFVVRNFNGILSLDIRVPDFALPLGISFFTFQAISYVVDVYRGTVPVQKNPFYVGLYIAFFPQLIAGPIVRYTTIAEQILTRKNTLKKFSVGMCRFITGMGKKILIANNMAIVADYIYTFTASGPVSAALAWLGSFAYTLQIFFDFSAYSDMAIGLGLIFGFEFDENFQYPYMSKSISEFWRRWHISMTTWFKDYVYFPLGGSRVKNKDTMVRNLFIVWLLTGVWHGAEWTFILWGLLNFLAILTERVLGLDKSMTHPFLKRVVTLLLVNFGWVLFRAPDLGSARTYLMNMFRLNGNPLWDPRTAIFLKEYWPFFLMAVVFSTPIAGRYNKLLTDGRAGAWEHVMNICYPIAMLSLFAVCVAYLVKGSYNPFIYFNF